jgi:hypothetical protein
VAAATENSFTRIVELRRRLARGFLFAGDGAPSKPDFDRRRARLDFDPHGASSIERIVDAWAPFVVAMNSVTRAMGRPDLYPFVIAPAVVEKLRFIHDLVRGAAMGEI